MLTRSVSAPPSEAHARWFPTQIRAARDRAGLPPARRHYCNEAVGCPLGDTSTWPIQLIKIAVFIINFLSDFGFLL